MSPQDKKYTILVIEDEVSLKNALCEKLAHEGFSTLEAKNGKEGMEVALRDHPDLILLDIVMPVMDGMAMLHKIREDTWGKSVHVIILTNVSDTKDVAEAMENETFDYFVKTDIKIEEVITKIKEKLKS